MKKVLSFILLLWAIFWWATFACEEVEMTNGDVCIDIEKDDDTYTLERTLTNTNWSVSLRCDILLPNNQLKYVGACNGEFTYDWEWSKKIKIYVQLNGDNDNIEQYYDFDDGEWTDSSSSSSSSDEDLDNFYLTTDDTTPSTSQRVDLRIKARDDDNETITDYNGTVDFKVYYRTSSSASWTLTTSSTYFEINEDYEDWYEFDEDDDEWYATLSDFIKLKKSYDYKVRVYDTDDTSIYKELTFDVWGSSSDSTTDGNNFKVTASSTTPETNERVDLTIAARDWYDVETNYSSDITFDVKYQTSNSYSRLTAPSSYYTINTTNNRDDDYDNGIEFRSYRQWSYKFNDFIKFHKNYKFKIIVTDADDEDRDWYTTIDISEYSNSSIDGFTSSELIQVERMYNVWDNLIDQLKAEYDNLDNSNYWQTLSDNLYDEMEKILEDDNDRYEDYDEFNKAFLTWYRYTINTR